MTHATHEESVIGQVQDAAQRLFADLSEAGGRSAREALDRGDWPASAWAQIEAAGFDRLLADDLDGEGWACAAAVLRAMGYHALGVPLLETMLARGLLSSVGGDTELPGPLTVLDASEQNGPVLERVGLDVRLQLGNAKVGWACHAKHLLVTGLVDGEHGVAIFSLNPCHAADRAGSNLAGEPRNRLDGLPLTTQRWHRLSSPLSVRYWGALGTSCAMVGAAQRVLDLSLVYANDRVQFGRSIGKFQVLQHALAALSCEVAAATMAVQVACDAAEWGTNPQEIAVAKIRAGQAAGLAASVGHQVHGAIGFTDEHSLHHSTRRLWAWRREWGTERDWALVLGAQLLAGGSAQAWPLIVDLSSATSGTPRRGSV